MNYYSRTFQVLAQNDAINAARARQLAGLHEFNVRRPRFTGNLGQQQPFIVSDPQTGVLVNPWPRRRRGMGDDSIFSPAVQNIFNANAASPPVIAGAPAAPIVGLPAGSQLTYSATWQTGKLLQDYTAVVNMIKLNLASQGIIIDNSSGKAWYQSGYGLTLQLHTTSDRNAATDVQAIIDNQIYTCCAGEMPQSSIAVSSLAAPQPGAGFPGGTNFPQPPGQPFNLSQFVSDHWQALAIGGVAYLFLRDFL